MMSHGSQNTSKISSILIVVASHYRLTPTIVDRITKNLNKEKYSWKDFSWVHPYTACRWLLSYSKNEARARINQVMEEISSSAKVDWGIIDSRQKFPKLLVSDMESTIIQEECLDELARRTKTYRAVNDITKAAMDGHRDFSWSLRKRLEILKGTSHAILESIPMTPSPGALTMLSYLKKQGVKTVLISGGLDYFARKVTKLMQFDAFEANTAVINENGLIGLKENSLILDAEAKGRFLKHYARKYSCQLQEVLAIGDGANDQILLKKAGISIAYKPHRSLIPYADMIIKYTNLVSVSIFVSVSRIFSDKCMKVSNGSNID